MGFFTGDGGGSVGGGDWGGGGALERGLIPQGAPKRSRASAQPGAKAKAISKRRAANKRARSARRRAR